MSTEAARLAVELRQSFLNKPFGIIKFWGMAVIPANDQSYELVSTHAEGDRLDLVFVHESRSGLAGVLSIWEPEGLEPASGQGVLIRRARRLQMDDTEASLDGTQCHMRNPRGEGTFAIDSDPALVLAR